MVGVLGGSPAALKSKGCSLYAGREVSLREHVHLYRLASMHTHTALLLKGSFAEVPLTTCRMVLALPTV